MQSRGYVLCSKIIKMIPCVLPDSADPLIITVAGVGAELTKKNTPYVPTTPDEIVEEAIAVDLSGAHVFHLHVRDQKGRPTLKPELIKKVVQKIRKKTKLVVQISTGGDVKDSFDSRLKTLVSGVQMGSLTCGTTNFGDDVFLNPRPFIEKLAKKMMQKKIIPELEIFDTGMMETALDLHAKGLLVSPLHFNLVLGGPGWLAGTIENLEFLLKKIPAELNHTWSASGIGRAQLPLIEYAIKNGGHVRTGLEDNIYLSKGVLAKGNVELVVQVVELAKKHQRRLATEAEVKQILKV